MNHQNNSTTIGSHVNESAKLDLESKEIIGVLEQLKGFTLKITDTNTFENEGIKLMELLYDQIALLRDKQKAFKEDIEDKLKKEGISFIKEGEGEPETSFLRNLINFECWSNDSNICLSGKDLESIKQSTLLHFQYYLNRIIFRVDNIFERLMKLKSCSFNSDEYRELKEGILALIYGGYNGVVSGFARVSSDNLSKEIFSNLINTEYHTYKNIVDAKKGKKIKEKGGLLNTIIEMLNVKFDIENIDLKLEFYEKYNNLIVYLETLGLNQKVSNVENVNLTKKIQFLIDEIATVITEKSPEINSLITEKIEKKLSV